MTVEGFSSVICLVQEDPEARCLSEQPGVILLLSRGETPAVVSPISRTLKATTFCLKSHSAGPTLIVF